MSSSPTFVNNACPSTFLNDASPSDEEEEQNHMLKRLQFLQEAISHYFNDYPEEADTVTITAQEWKICYHQIEITLKTVGS